MEAGGVGMSNTQYSIHIFMTKLENILVDPILRIFEEMARSAQQSSSSYNILQEFQLRLRDIKTWHDTGKDEEIYERIMSEQRASDIFPKLLQAIFRHHIYAILRNNMKAADNIIRSFDVPKGKCFVHKVCLDVAANVLWKNPRLIYDTNQRLVLKHEISDTIRSVVHMFIPMQDLLSVGGAMPMTPYVPKQHIMTDDDTFERMLHGGPPQQPQQHRNDDDAIIVIPGDTLDKLDPISDMFGNLAAGANKNIVL